MGSEISKILIVTNFFFFLVAPFFCTLICYPTLLLLSSLILVFFCIFRASLISSVGKESTFNAGDPGSPPGLGGSLGEGIGYPLQYSWAFLVAQLVKNPPAMRETWVRLLVWEDPLEKGNATHSSFLAWRIPWIV